MTRTALVIGGSGQVGRPAVEALLRDGWDVTVAARSPQHSPDGARRHVVDRNDDEAMDALLRKGFDVAVDVVAFTPAHASQLTRHRDEIGSAVVVSTAGMYVDRTGRALESITDEDSAPRFSVPVAEDDAVVPAGDSTYARGKRAMELSLLAEPQLPTTLLRPATIYGPGSGQPREWFYMRRILDGRRHFVLGYDGHGAYHPVSALNLAEMIRRAAARPGTRVLNAADPGRPDESATVRAVAAALGVVVDVVTVPGPPPVASPWSLPAPVFLDMRRADAELGHLALEEYAEGIAATVAAMREEVRAGTLPARLAAPRFGAPGLGVRLFMGGSQDPFDYAAEDRVLQGVTANV